MAVKCRAAEGSGSPGWTSRSEPSRPLVDRRRVRGKTVTARSRLPLCTTMVCRVTDSARPRISTLGSSLSSAISTSRSDSALAPVQSGTLGPEARTGSPTASWTVENEKGADHWSAPVSLQTAGLTRGPPEGQEKVGVNGKGRLLSRTQAQAHDGVTRKARQADRVGAERVVHRKVGRILGGWLFLGE